MKNHTTAPTNEELQRAFGILIDANVNVVCDLSLATIADIVRGAPAHSPTRFTPAETRLARAVLILAAATHEAEKERDGYRAVARQLASIGLGEELGEREG